MVINEYSWKSYNISKYLSTKASTDDLRHQIQFYNRDL